ARIGLRCLWRIDEPRLAAANAVDIERGLGPRAVVEVVGRLAVERSRACLVEDFPAFREALQAVDLELAEGFAADAELIGEQAVAASGHCGQSLHEHMDRVQR